MKKKVELSFINVWLCLLVIFIHVASEPVSSLIKGSIPHALVFIPWRLAAFVVQGFIFLSGLKTFLSLTKKKHFKYSRYYLSKITNIILPYVIVVFIFYVYFVKKGYFEGDIGDLWNYILNGDLCAHFYFIVAIIQFYALLPLWKWMVNNVRVYVAIPVALAITVLFGQFLPDFVSWVSEGYQLKYNDRLFTTYIFYWVAGCYAGANYTRFKAAVDNKKVRIGSLVLFVVTAAANGAFSLIQAVSGVQIEQLENLHILYCIGAIAGCCVIASAIGEYMMEFSVIKKIDRASLYIYLIHPLIIYIANSYIAEWGITAIDTAFVLRFVITYIASIVLCSIFVSLKRWLTEQILKSIYGE